MSEKYSDLFLEFWKAYPRKTAKRTAFSAWQKHVDETDAFMARAVIDNVNKRNRLRYWSRDVSKIPHAATFINQGRWEDEGWEDEIKTREDEKPNTGLPEIKEPERPMLHPCAMMLNRLMLSYLRICGSFSDEQMETAKAIKADVNKTMQPVIDEEIANDPSQRKQIYSDTGVLFLDRLDKALGFEHKQRIVANARAKASVSA